MTEGMQSDQLRSGTLSERYTSLSGGVGGMLLPQVPVSFQVHLQDVLHFRQPIYLIPGSEDVLQMHTHVSTDGALLCSITTMSLSSLS